MKLPKIEPPLARGGGFAEGKDGGVVAKNKSKLYTIELV